MALAKGNIADLTMDDLLDAINPRPLSMDERFRRATAVIVKNWQDGNLTDEQAKNLLQAIVAVKINGEMNQMVSDFFTPKSRQTLGDGQHPRF